jgi:hypothetical protein
LIEASSTDANTAYLIGSVPPDSHPHVTRDGGKTWQKIVNGLPDNYRHTIREDPKRKGWFMAEPKPECTPSFDSGDHWQSLQLNLPTTSVRDLNIHSSDLVAATYGRGLWILDDVSPLRGSMKRAQCTAKARRSCPRAFRCDPGHAALDRSAVQ